MQFVVAADLQEIEVGFVLAVSLSIVIILHKLHIGVTAVQRLLLHFISCCGTNVGQVKKKRG